MVFLQSPHDSLRATARVPVGGAKDQARFPRCHGGNAIPRAERVGAHSPAGDYSPFGVADLVGSV